jgi:hypothetical protein
MAAEIEAFCLWSPAFESLHGHCNSITLEELIFIFLPSVCFSVFTVIRVWRLSKRENVIRSSWFKPVKLVRDITTLSAAVQLTYHD